MRRRAQPWLGTLVEVSITDSLDEGQVRDCFDAAFACIANVHHLMSFHDVGSDVSRINRAMRGETVTVNAATLHVLRAAVELSECSGGLFDIACAASLVAWHYLPHPEGMPPEEAVSLDAFTLGSDAVIKRRAAWIDLGGIAKGYAVDAALEILKDRGVTSACINAGGDLRVLGDMPFEVAIRDPRNPSLPACTLKLRNSALATSATYFSAKHEGGIDYSALVHGIARSPVVGQFSISVTAPSCMHADALTKVVAATLDPHHPALARYGASAFII